MLLSVRLRFVSGASCQADGMQMYLRLPGSQARGKKPSRVERGIKEKSLPTSTVQSSLFPNASYLSFDLSQLPMVVLSPFYNSRN